MLKTTDKNNISDLYQQFLSDLPVGTIVLNTHGLIEYSNAFADRLLGDQLKGRSWLELLRTEIKNISHQGHYVALRNGIKVMITTQSSDVLNGQVLLLTDISSVKEEADNNNTLNNLHSINKLSATLAHQLKTPLSTALVYLSTLKTKMSDKQNVLKPITKSIEQLNIIKYLIENELTIFKTKDINVEPIILEKMISHIVAGYNDLYPDMTFNFNISNNTQSTVILGHKEALTSAINNIIDNAVEASFYKGIVDITTLNMNENVYINVIDYGVGIQKLDFNKVDQTFFTTKKKGSGLGVPIAKSIIEAHQGNLSFSSNAEYTTFTICVPSFGVDDE